VPERTSHILELSVSKKSRKKRDRKKSKANHGRRPNA
jgi:hypothetical protein